MAEDDVPPLNAESWVLATSLRALLDFEYLGTASTQDAYDRLAGPLGLEAGPAEPKGTDAESWTACLQGLIVQAGPEKFNKVLRAVLEKPAMPEPTIVLGPVIGKVTETTARIMMECSHDAQVTCTLTPKDDNTANAGPVSVSAALPRGRAEVLRIGGLEPGKLYDVKLEGAKVLVDRCSFRTVPAGGWQLSAGAKPNFTVASCNSVYTSRQLPHDSPANLWQDLGTRMKTDTQIDYMLHLGDNVYNDIEWCCVEKGAKELEAYDCKWGIAHNLLSNLPPEQWPDFRADIEKLFRTVYYETWGYPPQRWVLANVPNLMIYDDHDIRDDWGDRVPDDMDKTSLERFLGDIAFKLVNEYQMQLHCDLPEEGSPPGFHFHAFGEIGVVFLDLRACKTFHKTSQDEASPMLGTHQWRSFEDALFADDGTFSGCDVLLVMSPQPVAYVSPQPTAIAGRIVCDDLLGQWSALRHRPEVPRLLHSLNSWRDLGPKRAVLLIGGDVHEGGWSDVTMEMKSHTKDAKEKEILLCMRQLTTSAIANKMTKAHEALAVAITRDIAGFVDGWSISGGWSFLHYDWTNRRNYAILDFGVDVSSCRATVGAILVASDGESVELMERHDTSERPKSEWARLAGLKDMGGQAAGAVKYGCSSVLGRCFGGGGGKEKEEEKKPLNTKEAKDTE